MTRRRTRSKVTRLRTSKRGDGFVNALSGMGMAARDRRTSTTYTIGVELARQPELIRSLMRSCAIARKIVSKQVYMAFGSGLDWTVADPVQLRALMATLRRLRAVAQIKSGRVWGRAFGMSLLVANIDDGAPSSDPLDLTRVDTLHHLRIVEKWQIVHTEYDHSGGARDGLPERYTIQSADGKRVQLHHSRCFRFDGLEVDAQTYARLGGSHDTVLQPVWQELRDHETGGSVLSKQLEDSIKAVYKIRGLSDAIASGNADFVRDWIGSMELFSSAFRAMGLDAESESVSYLTMPLSASKDVFMALMHRVSASSDLPLIELFGMVPGGLGTDNESGTRRFYDKISSEERQGQCGGALDWVLSLITAQRTDADLYGAQVGYEWRSLWSPTAAEQAALRKQKADAHAVMVQMGAWSAQQAAQALAADFGVELEAPDADADAPPPPDTIVDPADRVMQARLALESGLLHLPDTAQTFRPIVGLPPLAAADTLQWQRLIKGVEPGAGGDQ